MPASFTIPVVEGVSGFNWVSPAFSGTAPFSLQILSSLPPGFSVVVAGSSIQVFGSLPFGVDGSWPVALALVDAVVVVSYFSITLDIAPSWSANEADVDQDSISLGEFYYALAGGPLRKEFQWLPN